VIFDDRLRAGGAAGHRCNLHLDGPFARDPPVQGEAACREEDDKACPDDPSRHAGPFRLALDTQRVEVALQVAHQGSN
jgi:hypothetical protein